MEKTIEINRKTHCMMIDAEYAPANTFNELYKTPENKINKTVWEGNTHDIILSIHGAYMEKESECGGYNKILLTDKAGNIEDEKYVYLDVNIDGGKRIALKAKNGTTYGIVLAIKRKKNPFLSKLKSLLKR